MNTTNNQAGYLDKTYGTDGYTSPPEPNNSNPRPVTQWQKGILFAPAKSGSVSQLVHFDEHGQRNVIFGPEGRRDVVPSGLTDFIIQVIIPLLDGYIVAGSAKTLSGDGVLAVLKYYADSRPDPTFGDKGQLEIRFDRIVTSSASGAPTADGGYILPLSSGSSDILLKLTPKGDVDTEFGPDKDGTVKFDLGTGIKSVIPTASGQILVVGTYISDGYSGVLSLTPKGGLDAAYGRNGYAIFTNGTTIFQGKLNSEDNLIVCGESDGRGMLAMLTPEGQTHPEFNGGEPVVDSSDVRLWFKCDVGHDNRIFALGIRKDNFIVARRYDQAGAQDMNYGQKGTWTAATQYVDGLSDVFSTPEGAVMGTVFRAVFWRLYS